MIALKFLVSISEGDRQLPSVTPAEGVFSRCHDLDG